MGHVETTRQLRRTLVTGDPRLPDIIRGHGRGGADVEAGVELLLREGLVFVAPSNGCRYPFN